MNGRQETKKAPEQPPERPFRGSPTAMRGTKLKAKSKRQKQIAAKNRWLGTPSNDMGVRKYL